MVFAIPLFGDEVAPRFCFAPELLVVEVDGGEVVGRARVSMVGLPWPERLWLLESRHVELLLCGGLDRRVMPVVRGLGVRVVFGLVGDAEELIARLLRGELAGRRDRGRDRGRNRGRRWGGRRGRMERESKRMLVAVAAADDLGLDGQVDPRFGRAERFVIVDAEAVRIEGEIDNPAVAAAHGAGPAAASAVAEGGARAVVAGRFGPNAVSALAALGVEAFEAPAGMTVRAAVEGVVGGTLRRSAGDAIPHGGGRGLGGGGGRGLGGGGRGLGGGGGGRGRGGGRGLGGGGGGHGRGGR